MNTKVVLVDDHALPDQVDWAVVQPDDETRLCFVKRTASGPAIQAAREAASLSLCSVRRVEGRVASTALMMTVLWHPMMRLVGAS